MPSLDAVAEAYVRLRPKLDDNFQQDASQAILPGLQRIAADAASLFVGKKLLDVGVAGLDELKESQQVTAQTTQELKNLGGQTDVTSDQVDKLGQQMLDLAGFDDEAGRSAANVLLRFKEITDSQTLTRVENDAADLAVTMGTDLSSAARTLGLALEDPEKAIRLLRSANVVLDQSQQDALKSAAQLGDQQTVNNIILGQIEQSIGGAAKAYGDTLAGAQDKARESLKNAKADLVGGFAPALELGTNLVTDFTQKLSEAPGPVKELAGGIVLLGGGAAAVARPIADLLQGLNALKSLRGAGPAATAADTAANTANAASVQAAAVAQGELAVGEAAVATNSAAAVAGLYAESAAADAAGASMLATVGIVGLAVGGVLALGAATGQFDNTLQAVSDQTLTQFDSSLSSTLEKVDKGTDIFAGVGKSVNDALGKDSGLAKAFNDAGLTTDSFIDILRRGDTEFLNHVHASDAAKVAIGALAGETEKQAQNAIEAAVASGRLDRAQADGVESSNRLANGQANFVAALQQLVNEGKIAPSVLDDVTKSIGGVNSAAGDTAGLEAMKEAAKETADALQGAKDRLQSLSDLASGAPGSDIAAQRAALGLEDARQREADATQKLKDARASGDPKAIAQAEEDLQKAHLDTKQAALDAADAAAKYKDSQDALNGTLDDAQTKAADARDSLAFFAGQLGGPLAEELQPYIDQLGQVVSLQNQLSDLNAPDVALKEYASGGVRRFASGGVAGPGEEAIVGEDAPEFLRVNALGQAVVTPIAGASRRPSMRATATGGDTYHNYFKVVAPTPMAAASMIVARMRRRSAVRVR